MEHEHPCVCTQTHTHTHTHTHAHTHTHRDRFTKLMNCPVILRSLSTTCFSVHSLPLPFLSPSLPLTPSPPLLSHSLPFTHSLPSPPLPSPPLPSPPLPSPQSHAGKVVMRNWYERNKHIFPASRWEPYDPEKKWDKYTVSDRSSGHQAIRVLISEPYILIVYVPRLLLPDCRSQMDRSPNRTLTRMNTLPMFTRDTAINSLYTIR